nr:CinA family protein [Demequina sediminicola]
MTAASPNVATRVLASARQQGLSVAVAESLTGGSVCASLVAIPGASDVFRGGVVAYDSSIKTSVLGVSAELLAEAGPVSLDVAAAMALGVQTLLHSDVAAATTGSAGPQSHGGVEAGTVCVAAVTGTGLWARTVRFDGDRDEVRAGANEAALALLEAALSDPDSISSWRQGT